MPRTISRRRLATLALPVLAATITLPAPASASTTTAERTNPSTRNLGPLAGAWNMTRLEVGTPGRLQATPYSGQFLFTRSGTGSVQASNPDPNAPDTPYTVGGYEAYYGNVDIVRSTTRRGTTRGTFGLTIRSAAVRNLIGTRVTRNFVLTRTKLVLTPTNPTEGFRVTYRRF